LIGFNAILKDILVVGVVFSFFFVFGLLLKRIPHTEVGISTLMTGMGTYYVYDVPGAKSSWV
jgi:Mn2+/Fe2+ NRAMP family transporter